MRKSSVQTQEATGLMQMLGKGGWRKKAKKVLAGVLAGAMVLTSGVVMPQNAKPAEAAGISVGDSNFTLGFNALDDYYKVGVAAGNFTQEFSFHQDSRAGANWESYAIILKTEDGKTWYERADSWTVDFFDGTGGVDATAVTHEGNIVWENWLSTIASADVTVTVTRAGGTITINGSIEGGGNSYYCKASADNCPTGALTVYLGGEGCYLTDIEDTLTQVTHKLTIKYVDKSGKEIAPSESLQVGEGEYSFPVPDIEGYTPEAAIKTVTMGTADMEVEVVYSKAEQYTVTVDYVYEDGREAAPSKSVSVDEGKEYAITSPTVSGYHPDKNTVKGTMEAEDKTITVIYKRVIATLNSDWYIYKDGYKVYKTGDFNVTYSFHTQTDATDPWVNYGIGITADLSTEYNKLTDWFMRSDAYNLTTFSGLGGMNTGFATGDDPNIVYQNDYWDATKRATFAQTIQDAEITVSVVRSGTTIVISTTIEGANGEEFFGTATATNCPSSAMNVFLTAAAGCELNLYSATASDIQPKEGNFVVVHYVYEDGSEAAPDEKLGWIENGQSYSVKSPDIDGYTPDKPTVAGVMDGARVEETVTYTGGKPNYIATVGSVNADGSYSLGYGILDSYYGVQVPAGDFDVSFSFRNLSAVQENWFNYLIALISEENGDMYLRGDAYFVSAFGMAAEWEGIDMGSINWDTFRNTIKSSNVSVSISRKGDTISFNHSVAGDNGESFSWSATRSGCPTGAMTVYLGGDTCYLGITEAIVNGVAQEPEEPSDPTTPSDPTDTPSDPTDTPSDPTDTPSEPTETPSEPTTAPSVSKGDKVTVSNATYKVTSTKNNSVTYTGTKNSKKTSITVPKTVKVTSGGKTVTYKVTTVAKGAFKNNDSVKKITIGANITKIEANAFKGCDNLTTIIVKSTKLKTVANNALKGTSKKLVIKVPAKKLSAYKKLFSGKGNNNVTVKKA